MRIDEEFSGLIPPLTDEEYRGLEQSILSDGCRDALVAWGDVLVDGHNRYRICEANGVSYSVVQKEFAGRDEAKLWMMRNQLSRRNLNDFQRIEIVRKCEDAVKSEAKIRQGTRTDLLAPATEAPQEEVRNIPPKVAGRDARDELAGMAGVGHTTYERAVKVLEKAPEVVVNAVRKDELSINAGYEVTKLPEAEQEEITERITHGEAAKSVVSEVRGRVKSSELGAMAGVSGKTYDKAVKVIETAPASVKDAVRSGELSINQAYQQVRRSEREARREEVRHENTEKVKELSSPLEAQGLFQTIVIDPAWDWGDEGDVNQFGRARPDYHTMPLEEIAELPIARIADENCHLYLWVTNRSLPKAFQLMDKWCFRYITCLTWVKPSIGMGNYFRGQTEQVLFGVKGSQGLKRHDVGTYFEAPRGYRHSEKPDRFYEIVESCSYAPYIDIFGRKEREGWAVWGENG